MVVVKRVKATGFKSFAKPTEFLLDDNLSGIIGPNGSGKSNIVDVMCFVLGRISAKSLRAEKSANLIYNGGKNGRPAKQAEAIIVFDNVEKKFPVDAKEVEVKRVLNNKGLSKYYINNELRTRQQVLDVLNHAKINPDGHNIILQGDITQVAEMASDGRKKVLEDISGISIYEDKKDKTIRELERVQGRLSEANIVLVERESYLKELKKDRDVALKYKDLEKNISRNKATFLHLQVKNKEEEVGGVDKKLEQNKNGIDKIQEEISRLNSSIESKKNEINEIIKEIQEKSEQKQLSLQNEITGMKDDISRNSARVDSLKLEVDRINERKKQLKLSMDDANSKDDVLQLEKNKLESELAKLKQEKSNVESKIGKLRDDVIDKELDKQIGVCLDEDSSLGMQLTNARGKHSNLVEKLAVLKARQSGQNESHMGNRAVEAVKKIKGVHGIISELGNAEDRYSLALETVGGNRLNAVVVEDDNVASNCIKHLKENRLGTAIFLPLNKIKGGKLPDKKVGHGLALNLIKFDDKYKNAFEYVFGSTYVMNSINEARKNIGRFRMVTLDGDLLEGSGAMVGGYRRKKALFKNYSSDIDKIRDEVVHLEGVISTLGDKRIENDKVLSELKQKMAKQSENVELNALEDIRQDLNEKVIVINSDLKNLNMQINEMLSSEKDSISRILKQHDNELNEFEGEIKDLSKVLEEQRKETKEKEKLASKFYSKYRESFGKRDRLSGEIQKIELKINDQENKITIFEDRINSINNERAKLVSELEGLNVEFEQYKDITLRKGVSYDQLRDEIYKFEGMLKNMGNVNLRALEIYDQVEEEYANLQAKVDKLSGEREDVLKMIEEIETKKTGVFMKTFNAIASNFERIFSNLTHKGTAHLILENPEKPLEGGIRILVRISSDRFLDIKSLSGGEKTLTALAFIFSIQEHDPASFYVLDEVDAALDKRNSEMLANLLAEYSKKAQYIVISHNDAIINSASRLYGVSMRDNGMSNVVSLKV